jgi:hypothetical protein
VPHTRLVDYSDIASSIAVLVSVVSVGYTRHAARAARDQAGAARDHQVRECAVPSSLRGDAAEVDVLALGVRQRNRHYGVRDEPIEQLTESDAGVVALHDFASARQDVVLPVEIGHDHQPGLRADLEPVRVRGATATCC